MKVFDRNGVEHDVPDVKAAQDALVSGQAGLPAGTRVPVKTKFGAIGTIPIESLSHAVGTGSAQLISDEEHKDYLARGAGHAVLAGIEGGVQGATSDFAEPAIAAAASAVSPETGKAVREHFLRQKRVHNIASGIGEFGGALAVGLVTGGLGEAGEAANLARVGEEGLAGEKAAAEAANLARVGEEGLAGEKAAAEASHLAPDASEVLSGEYPYREAPVSPNVATPPPQEIAAKLAAQGGTVPVDTAAALTRGAVDEAAAKDVIEKIGKPGQELLGRLSKHAMSGAGYGAAQGIGETISEDQLSQSHDLTAQKLLAAGGEGALFGGLMGAGVGAGAELFGKTARAAGGLADTQWFRSMLTSADQKAVQQADALPGGRKALGRFVEQVAGAKAGDTAAQIEEKVNNIVPKLGETVGHFRTIMDKEGVAGPTLKSVLHNFEAGSNPLYDGVGIKMARAPELYKAERAFADDTVKPLLSKYGDQLSFAQAQELKEAINDKINSWGPRNSWSQETFGKQDILRGAYHALEDATEEAGKRAESKMGGRFLEPYKEAKLQYRQALVAQKILEKSSQKTGGSLAFGLGSLLSGIHGAIGLHGIPGGGLVASMMYKMARERGNTASAALLDKLATLGGVQNAIARTDREVERGIAQIVRPGKRIPPRFNLKDSTTEQRMLNVQRILRGEADPAGHIAAPLEQHAPNVSKSVTGTAARAVNFLGNLLPRPYQQSTLEPPSKKPEPANYSHRAKFDRAYVMAVDPVQSLQNVHDGTLTRDEVECLKNVHGDWYQDTCKKLTDATAEHGKKLPTKTLVSMSIFLDAPVTPLMDPRILAQLQGNKPSPTPGGTVHGKKMGGPSGMKPLHTAPKDAGKSLTLTGLSKETLL